MCKQHPLVFRSAPTSDFLSHKNHVSGKGSGWILSSHLKIKGLSEQKAGLTLSSETNIGIPQGYPQNTAQQWKQISRKTATSFLATLFFFKLGHRKVRNNCYHH